MGNKTQWGKLIASFIGGFVSGQLFEKAYRTHTLPSASSLQQNKKFIPPFPNEDMKQAILIIAGVYNEVLNTLEKPKDIEQMVKDMDQASKSQNVALNIQRDFQAIDLNEIKGVVTWGRNMISDLQPEIAALFTSSTFSLPTTVSPQVENHVNKLIDISVRKIRQKSAEAFDSLRSFVPALELVLAKWVNESRPDTATKTLLHAIHAIKSI